MAIFIYIYICVAQEFPSTQNHILVTTHNKLMNLRTNTVHFKRDIGGKSAPWCDMIKSSYHQVTQYMIQWMNPVDLAEFSYTVDLSVIVCICQRVKTVEYLDLYEDTGLGSRPTGHTTLVLVYVGTTKEAISLSDLMASSAI